MGAVLGKRSKSGTRAEYDQKGLRWIADYAIKRPRACLLYHAEHVVVRDLIFQKSGFGTCKSLILTMY